LENGKQKISLKKLTWDLFVEDPMAFSAELILVTNMDEEKLMSVDCDKGADLTNISKLLKSKLMDIKGNNFVIADLKMLKKIRHSKFRMKFEHLVENLLYGKTPSQLQTFRIGEITKPADERYRMAESSLRNLKDMIWNPI
jgi:hypothetical protein